MPSSAICFGSSRRPDQAAHPSHVGVRGGINRSAEKRTSRAIDRSPGSMFGVCDAFDLLEALETGAVPQRRCESPDARRAPYK